MASTTNYGWSTPDDTALVKDGASAIRTLGSAIDTTVKSVSDSIGTTAIAKSIVDAKGDIIAATAADTVSRLAVGTDGQALLADSTAATGLKWGSPPAGSLTLLSTTTLSGALVTISSISQSYKHLYAEIKQASCTTQGQILIQMNGNNFDFWTQINADVTTVKVGSGIFNGQNIASNNNENHFGLTFPNYSDTNAFKYMNFSGFAYLSSTGNYSVVNGTSGRSAVGGITSIGFSNSNGGNFNGGTVKLYGVN